MQLKFFLFFFNKMHTLSYFYNQNFPKATCLEHEQKEQVETRTQS